MNEEGKGSSGDGCNVVECCWRSEKMQRLGNEVGDMIYCCECEVNNISLLLFFSISLSCLLLNLYFSVC